MIDYVLKYMKALNQPHTINWLIYFEGCLNTVILSVLQSMRNWLEDLTWSMYALNMVKRRGEIACLLKEILLEKGLPTRNNLNWDETEINMLKELNQTVINTKVCQ